jgi:molecular chaperone IbpA
MAELNPLYRTLVGFDRIASLMDQAARLDAAPGYPPFNVEQVDEDSLAARTIARSRRPTMSA